MRALQAEGVDLHFVAFKPRGSEDFPGCEHLYQDIQNIEIIEIEPHGNDTLLMKAYVDASANYLRQHQQEFDKIILDSWFTVMAGVIAQIDYDKTYHLVQSDPYFDPENESVIWKSRAFELLPYFPLKRIVVSHSVQQLFQDRYEQYYPNINLFIDDAYRRADFGISDQPTIRFITSASDFNILSKGLDFLVDTLQELQGKQFSLTILSGKPLNRDFSRYNFPISVTSAQGPEQMIEVMRTHDVYVNTSVNETFCLALAEAITLGMPAIALDSVGNRDYAKGDNFIFVKDQKDFSAQLAHIMNFNVRARLHKAARPSMQAYNINTTVRQFKEAVGL